MFRSLTALCMLLTACVLTAAPAPQAKTSPRGRESHPVGWWTRTAPGPFEIRIGLGSRGEYVEMSGGKLVRTGRWSLGDKDWGPDCVRVEDTQLADGTPQGGIYGFYCGKGRLGWSPQDFNYVRRWR